MIQGETQKMFQPFTDIMHWSNIGVTGFEEEEEVIQAKKPIIKKSGRVI